MGEFFTWVAPILIIIFIGFIVILAICMVCDFITKAVCKPMLEQITQMGYDGKEVRIFCHSIDASLENFIDSKGLQKQYERFHEGETSEFYKEAKAIKQKRDAHTTGLAAGIACGVAISGASK